MASKRGRPSPASRAGGLWRVVVIARGRLVEWIYFSPPGRRRVAQPRAANRPMATAPWLASPAARALVLPS